MAANPPENTGNPSELDVQSKTSSFGVVPLLGIAILIGMGVPTVIWMSMQDPELTPFEKTVNALEALDLGLTRTAYMSAIQMLSEGVEDPEVGGTLEYIIGVAHFRKAEQVAAEAAPGYEGIVEPIYLLAKRFLEQANRKSLMAELVPNWRYTLGSCYYKLGQIYEARELLEAALDSAEVDRDDIILMLAQCYLDPNVLKMAIVHPTSVVEQRQKRKEISEYLKREYSRRDPDDFDSEYKYRTLLCLAEFKRQDGEFEEAEVIANQLLRSSQANEMTPERAAELKDALVILRSRILIDRGKTEQARELLETIVDLNSGFEQKSVLEGYFLFGLSYDADDRLDLALESFAKPALVHDSPVSFPANLYAGDIARKRGTHEEALQYFLAALAMVESTDAFANSWIDLDRAREIIQDAWNEWGNSDSYEQFRLSIQLAQNMVPLFSRAYANELTALASRKRAEYVQSRFEKELDNLKDSEVREQWKRAGQAYARLANSSRASAKYGQILWDSSHFYRRGNDFQNSLIMLDRYIASNPRTGLPAAYTFKAQLLLDLDGYDEEPRLEQAIEILQQTIRDYPKDQLVYAAQVMLGKAYLELGDVENAIQVWRKLLLESPLAPEAEEWQQALFFLGRTLFHDTETRPDTLLLAEDNAAEEEQDDESQQRFEIADEAIFWLDEFVRRIPDHQSVNEARWLLAKGLRFRARRPEQILAAETDNLKQELTENMKQELKEELTVYLNRALEQFSILANELIIAEQKGELDPIRQQFLRDAYFEPAHIQFDLGQFDPDGEAYRQAIDRYSNAAFYFTKDPIVILAYYRIAECYRHLNAYSEGRRQLEQARVILNQIPEPFPVSSTNFTKDEWDKLLEQSIRLYDLSLQNGTVATP